MVITAAMAIPTETRAIHTEDMAIAVVMEAIPEGVVITADTAVQEMAVATPAAPVITPVQELEAAVMAQRPTTAPEAITEVIVVREMATILALLAADQGPRLQQTGMLLHRKVMPPLPGIWEGPREFIMKVERVERYGLLTVKQ
jgi:hypothetical protein